MATNQDIKVESGLIPPEPVTSSRMKAIRSQNTRPELRLRSLLHRRGRRFRKNFRIEAEGLKVRPDIVFTRQKVAVFVDGCFWHLCPEHGHIPRTNTSYWEPKLRRNVQRDQEVDMALADSGWTVVRLWEHVDLQDAADSIDQKLTASAARP